MNTDVKLFARVMIQCAGAYVTLIGVSNLREVRLLFYKSTFEIVYFTSIAVVPVVVGLLATITAGAVSDRLLRRATAENQISLLGGRLLQIAAIFALGSCVPDILSLIDYFYGLINGPSGDIPSKTITVRNILILGVALRLCLAAVLWLSARPLTATPSTASPER
jgi:hypothetical protein